jgi:hypothetical protein
VRLPHAEGRLGDRARAHGALLGGASEGVCRLRPLLKGVRRLRPLLGRPLLGKLVPPLCRGLARAPDALPQLAASEAVFVVALLGRRRWK